jgi:hypothetical protein
VFMGMNHFQLLADVEVWAQVERWLAGEIEP